MHNNKVSKSLYDDYVKINETHNHNMRQVRNEVYFKLRINKSVRNKRLVYRGFESWKNIDESLNFLNWPSFKNTIKVL